MVRPAVGWRAACHSCSALSKALFVPSCHFVARLLLVKGVQIGEGGSCSLILASMRTKKDNDNSTECSYPKSSTAEFVCLLCRGQPGLPEHNSVSFHVVQGKGSQALDDQHTIDIDNQTTVWLRTAAWIIKIQLCMFEHFPDISGPF